MRIFLGLVFLFLTYMYLIAFYANNLDKVIFSLLTMLFIGINFFVINTHKKIKPILLSVLLILLFNLYWVNFKLYEESYLSFLPKNVVEIEFLAPFSFIYLLFTLLLSLIISKILLFIKGKEKPEAQINDSCKKEEKILSLEETVNTSPILIKGDERLDVEPIGIFGKYIILGWNLLLVFVIILSIFQGKFEFDYALFGWFISNVIIVFTLRVFYLFTPSYYRRCEEVANINSYFKKSFDLLNEFNHKEHTNLGVFNRESKINSEHAMFDLYMEAYKLNADAIVLNASNIATSVSGDRKSVRSTTVHHLTGTIIKYK